MKDANDYKKNRKFSQSFKDAMKGIWLCIRSERNMRIHTVCAVYVLFFASFLELSRTEYAILIVVIGLMISAEAFNTAIEKLCDFACIKKDRRIGAVKDIAAGAVFFSSIIAVFVGAVLLYRPDKILKLIMLFIHTPYYIAILLLCLVISLIFIIFGPAGIKNWFCRNHHNKKKGKC